jgi:GNAT superfamily N-acetyltransferase
VEIRKATLGESKTLSDIAWRAKSHWGYDAAAMATWREGLLVSEPSLITQPTFAAEIADRIAGFYQVSLDAEKAELEHFWVEPDFMRRGVGRAMLAHAVNITASHGFAELHIDSDPFAYAFYVACGAIQIGNRAAPIAGNPQRTRPQFVLHLPS